MTWRPISSRVTWAAAILVASIQAAMAQNAPPPLIRGFFELPVMIDRAPLKLEAMEVRPRGPGPFPLAVIAHGKDSGGEKRRAQRALGMTAQAVAFAERGFTVVVAMRRGYGTSQGNYAESDGACDATRFPEASRAGARDLTATIAAAASRPGVDRTRILVVGESVGGIAALAMATLPPPGVLGVINFAGGRGGNPDAHGPDGRNEVCQSDRLVDTVRAFGAAGKLPTLWIYAENDSVFGPNLARAMHRAYVAGGGKAAFAMLPAVDKDGHTVFSRGETLWRAPVDRFLGELGLPASRAAPEPKPPDGIGTNGQAAFRAYAQSLYPFKAFANSGSGPFGWAASLRSLDEARRVALANCQRGGRPCDVVSEVAAIEDR